MRSFNFRLFVILVVCLLVLAGGVHVLHEHQVKGQTRLFQDLADQAVTKHEPLVAADYLRRYLVMKPTDAQEMKRYGLLLADNGRGRDAVTPLIQTLNLLEADPVQAPELKADQVAVRKRLIELLVVFRRLPEAQFQIDKLWIKNEDIEKCTPDEKLAQAKLREQKAICEAGASQWSTAKDLLNDAITLDPTRIDSYAMKVALLMDKTQQPKPEDATKVLDQLVENNQDNYRSYLIRGAFYKEQVGEKAVQAKACGELNVTTPANEQADLVDELNRGHVLQFAYQDALAAVDLVPDAPPVERDKHGNPIPGDEACETARREQAGALLFAGQCGHELAQYATVLQVDEDFEGQARDFATRAMELNPKLAGAYGLLADIEIRSTDTDDQALKSKRAMEILRDGLEQAGSDPSLLWNLANLEIADENVKTARELIQRLETAQGTAALVQYLNARILISEKKWYKASQILEGNRPNMGDWPALEKEAEYWLAMCYGRIGRRDLQLTAYQKAGENDPFWIPALVGEAEALLAAGRTGDGLEKYRIAASLRQSTPGVRLNYVRLLVLLKLQKQNIPASWDALREELDKIRSLPDLSDDNRRAADMLIVEVLAARGDMNAAETYLKSAIASDPNSVDLQLTLAAFYQQHEQQWERVEQALREASEKFGDTAAVRLARARYLLGRYSGDSSARPKLTADLRTLSETSSNMPDDEVMQLAAGMFRPLLFVGETERAAELLQEISTRDKGNLPSRLLSFDLALQSQKSDPARADKTMQTILKEVEGIEGQGPLWRYGSAVRSMVLAESAAPADRDDDFNDALRDLAEAAKARPRWEKVPALQARIFDLRGEQEQAVRAYEEAFNLGSRDPQAILRLIQLYTDRGDLASASRILTTLSQETSPLSPQLAAAAAQLSFKLGSGEQSQNLAQMALTLAEEAQRNSDNYRDHLLYGQVLLLNHRNAEAEQAFLKARELAPQETVPWLILIQLYSQTDRMAEAQQMLETAADTFGAEKSALAVGQAYEQLKDLTKAEEHYAQALAAAPDDPHVIRTISEFYLRRGKGDEAKTLLNKLALGNLAGVEPADLLWGRRALAVLLMRGGDRASWDDARQLIEKNIVEGNNTLEDRRVKALVLSTRPTHAGRVEAIKLLETIVERGLTASAEDRLLLAQLHLAERAWHQLQTSGGKDPESAAADQEHRNEASRQFSAATRQLLQVIGRNDADPRAISLYAKVLLDNKQPSEAMLWLPKLKQHAADNRDCLTVALQVLLAGKQFDEAYTLLEELVPRELTAETAQAMLSTADLFATVGASAEARAASAGERFFERSDALLHELANFDERYWLAVASLDAARGRIAQAVDLIEQHAAAATPEDLANACLVTMRRVGTENALLDRLEVLLQGKLKEVPDSLPLKLIAADIHSWRDDAQGAEERYREVLQLSPNHVAAANNLAFLLASQGKDLNEALQWIELAISAQGELPELLDTRAYVRLKRHEVQAAVEDLSKAIAEAPQAAYLLHMTQAHLAAGQNDLAKAVWAKAMSAGLTETDLHPMERPAFRSVSSQLQ